MAELITVLLISVGLAMDAFAVSVSNAMTVKNLTAKQVLAYPLCFGIFQGVMPLIGFYVGSAFEKFVTAVDHWLALLLLGFIGGKMLIEGIKQLVDSKKVHNVNDETEIGAEFKFSSMMVQGLATSIDALAVGISFALTLTMNIFVAVLIIAAITFVISLLGMFIGKKFGSLLSNYAGIVGGLILIGIGLKIFIEGII